jgi:hypothetical protein
VLLPDTSIQGPVETQVRDLCWAVPATAAFSPQGHDIRLEYRLNQGDWSVLDPRVGLPFGGMAPGRYVVEVATVEDEYWRDPSPVRFEVEYAPDYEFVVESRMARLTGDDPADARRALEEIESGGAPAQAALRARQQELDRVVDRLRELLESQP